MSSAERWLTSAAPGVRRLSPYLPGKPVVELERELHLASIIKLASNENPLGPGAPARAAMRQAIDQAGLYPDGSGFALKRALSAFHGVSADCITLGNGSNEVLTLLAETFLTPADEAVYSEYCFAIYPLAVTATGATARIARALPATDPMAYGHDLKAIAKLVSDRTKLLFLANPNNPTGTWVTEQPLLTFLEALPPTTLCVLDEAYVEYALEHAVPDGSAWLERFPNLVIVRTFSKAYGLAGVRVGYALSDPQVAELLNRVRPPFNVSSLGLAGAEAALADREHVARTVALNRAGLKRLRDGLSLLGLSAGPSAGNFLLVDLKRDARPVFEALLRQGVIVRPLPNYGLAQHVRITSGTADENERLLSALPAALR